MFQPTKTNSAIPEADAFLDLDAMPTTLFDQTTDIRAEARLAQIMATNPQPEGQPTPARPRLTSRLTTHPSNRLTNRLTTRQLAFRLAAVPALAALIIAVSVFAPTESRLAPAPANAFATWTAVPAPLTGDRAQAATAACREQIEWSQSGQGPFPTATFQHNLPAQPTVAEQRGDWAIVQFDSTGSRAELVNCLIIFEADAPKIVTWISQIQIGPNCVGGCAGAQGFGFGDYALFDPYSINNELTGSFLAWEISYAADAGTAIVNYALDGTLRNSGEFSVLSGRVGADVVGAVFHTTAGIDVTATIANNQFVAWWPQYTGIDAPEMIESDDWATTTQEARFALDELVKSVTLTLADGTVLANQDVRTNKLQMSGTL